MSHDQPEVLTIRQVFADSRYRIPIYQRAYAWREDEIATLLRDIADSRSKDSSSRYYIGSLVVHAAKSNGSDSIVYEVVDGQQRLTTLFLILCHPIVASRLPEGLRDNLPRTLTFEGRDRSTADLALLARRSKALDGSSSPEPTLQDSGLHTGFTTIDHVLKSSEFPVDDEYVGYLLNHVKIVRAELPPNTDLNHYFEVMNSRGEQLEKHEIVKARLLSKLAPENRGTFADIWDACSDMSKHVQAKFAPGTRTQLFGDSWDNFNVTSPEQLFEKLQSPDAGAVSTAELVTGITALIRSRTPSEAGTRDNQADDDTGRYGSIIDFPNFLLHALKIHKQNAFTWASTDSANHVTLDDKQLVDQFGILDNADGVKAFGFHLLRLRFLFDNYVIKTDRYRDNTSDDSNWVLHRAHRTGQGGKAKLSPAATFGSTSGSEEEADANDDGLQKQVIMLQSMFQVTDSRRAYKNFLYGILDLLWRNQDSLIGAPTFLHGLHNLATKRYEHIAGDLDAGVNVPHFIFNFLDYKLWNRYGVEGGPKAPQGLDVTNFRFRYRTSVEHFYPQHPDRAERHRKLLDHDVNRFGNLCIMTRSENSRRSNLMPLAKIGQYASTEQSLKFQLMATVAQNRWEEQQIDDHGAEMRALLDTPLGLPESLN